MSFKLNITKEDVAKPTGSNSFIGTSGIYDVTVNAVIVDQNEHGQVNLGFYVDLGNNSTQALRYALPMSDWENKNPKEGNQKIFGALCTIAGVPLDTDFEPVEASLPIGKGGANTDVSIFEEFEDVEVKMWVKLDYYKKSDGSIGESKTIRGFFRTEDNASADEILRAEQDEEVEFGTVYSKREKYFEDVGYGKDDSAVTEAEVKEMIEARKSGNATPSKKTPATTAKKSKFAK